MLCVFNDLFVLHRFDRGDDCCRGEGVTRIGEPTGEDAFGEGVRNRVADDDTANGDVPRIDTLGEGDQVRHDVKRVEREPLASSTETAHHLVENQEHVVLVAQCANTGQVAGRRKQDAGRAGNRLNQEGGNTVGTLGLNRALQEVKCPFGLLFWRGRPVFRAVEVRTEDVLVAARVLIRDASPVASRHDGRPGVAVVRAVERDHLVASGVDARHTDGVFVGVSSTIREEDLVELLRSVRQNLLRRQRAHVVRVCRSHGGQNIRLGLNRRNHLGVLVPDVDVHQHAREVEVGIAFVVPDATAETARNDERRERALSRPRMKHAAHVGLAHGGVVCGVKQR